jgi:hypothetical protein
MMCFNFKLLRPTTKIPYFKLLNTWIRLQEVIQSTMNVICQICISYTTNISDFYRLQAYWNKHHSSMGAQRKSCEQHLQCVCKQGRIHGGRTRRAPHPHPLTLENKKIVWHKIVICHTKYPNIFAPPSARRNFFKSPLTWNPGSAPGKYFLFFLSSIDL